MYAVMTLVAPALDGTAPAQHDGVDFKVDKIRFHFLFLTMPALQLPSRRSGSERALPSDLGLDLGSHRPRAHDGHRLTLEALASSAHQVRSDPKLFVVFSASPLRLGRDLLA